MMDLYPQLPEFNPEELAELRTLRQIVQAMEANLPSAAPSLQPPPAQVPSDPVSSPTAPETALSSVPTAMGPGRESLIQGLFEVISAKTGYPKEMLEPDMEMEPELGIDRIRLIEILDAWTEQGAWSDNPDNTDHDELTELRTLEDLLLYINKISSEASGKTPAVEGVPQGFARLRSLPSPDYLEFALPDNHVCLITLITSKRFSPYLCLIRNRSPRVWPSL